jgi:hypothetical protein
MKDNHKKKLGCFDPSPFHLAARFATAGQRHCAASSSSSRRLISDPGKKAETDRREEVGLLGASARSEKLLAQDRIGGNTTF